MAHDALIERFEARGVPLVDVADGIVAPLRFSDPRAEHLASRRAAGLFDFSFMGCFEITGADAFAYLQYLQTRNLQNLRPGRIMYTLLCRDDGSVFNDATIWSHDAGSYWLFTGRRSDFRHLQAVTAGFDVKLADYSGRFAVIAVQGPDSSAILDRCFPGQQPGELAYYGFTRARFRGNPCWIARLGYTGERGYELVTGAAGGPELWEQLLIAGRLSGLMECGFEAADGLRIEAGHILFTRELAAPVTPGELGLSRLVSYYGAEHMGSRALRALRWKAPKRRLVGLLPAGASRRMLKVAGQFKCEQLQNMPPGTGQVTSQCASSIFERSLALGFVAYKDRYPGTRVRLANGDFAEVVRLPFYDPGKILPFG